MSRARLVTMITERMAGSRHARVTGATMAYESAADEMVFVFGPFLVGLLATLIEPWAPLVIAAMLTVVFVGAFALHPSGRQISSAHRHDGSPASSPRELFRFRLLIVVIGMLGVGVFFGAMLTSLTAFMTDRGVPEQAGLLYGVMGIGSAVLALGVTLLPPRFTARWRWLVFSGILFTGTLLLLAVRDIPGMCLALAFMGIGIGPSLVTQYGLGAENSPAGRLATVMMMVGSAVIVGQSAGAALTGWLAEESGTTAALLVPTIAAVVVMASGVVNAMLSTTGVARSRPAPAPAG